jgi:hypothetical protein
VHGVQQTAGLRGQLVQRGAEHRVREPPVSCRERPR